MKGVESDLSDWSEANSEKIVGDLKALYEKAKETRDRNIAASMLYSKVEETITANNMSCQDCIDILAITAPLCHALEPGRAKQLLAKFVALYV